MIILFWNKFYDNDGYQESYNVGGFHLSHFMLFAQPWERPTKTHVSVTVPIQDPVITPLVSRTNFRSFLKN